MAWTQADVDKLDEAFRSGAKDVTFSDRRVILFSVEEYQALRAMMLGEIEASGNGGGGGGSTTRPRYFLCYSRKGV